MLENRFPRRFPGFPGEILNLRFVSPRIALDPTLAAEGLSHTKLDGEVGLELRVYL